MEFEKVIGIKMNPDDAIWTEGADFTSVADTIASHLIQNRSDTNPEWKPYIKPQGFDYRGLCSAIKFDGYSYYPDAKLNDAVYTACDIEMEKDYEVGINIIGAVQAFLDGQEIVNSPEEALNNELLEDTDWYGPEKYEYRSIKLAANKRHRLVIKSICTENSFGYVLNISPPRCPSLWANFYLVMARTMLPMDPFKLEEGIAVSPLYSGAASFEEAYEKDYGFLEAPVYAYPELKKEDNYFDFKEIYKEGNVAFGYAKAENDGFAEVKALSKSKLIINSKEILTLDAGAAARAELKKNDILLVKSLNEKDGWGFSVTAQSGIGMSFLQTDRSEDFTFAICGPFYQKGFEALLPPEYDDFKILKPYPDGKNGTIFWRFKYSYLRAYMFSSFAGQWYYATMLSYKGIKDCGETLDKPEYIDYFMRNMSFMAEWYEYALYDRNNFGLSSFMCSASSEEHLDHIGTMGVNFLDAYQRTGENKYLYIIKTLQNRIKNCVPRFSDGTFCRTSSGTMWADDFYMSGPFLTGLYKKMGDNDSLCDIIKQIKGFRERLFMEDEKIYSHIFFLDNGVKNCVPWGRGNGWIALSMSEMLLQIPKDAPEFEIVRKAFSEFCEGIAACQDETGLYHQVLNRPQSYLETSCTAMFTLAMYRGVHNGWIDKKYLENADKGLDAILKYCVDKDGVVYGVCMGSSCSMDEQYYFDLTTIKDDNHGTGIVLMLLCEKIMMEREGK